MFKVGLYNLDIDVDDQIGRGKQLEENFTRYEWLHDVFPFHPSVFEMVNHMSEYLASQGYKPAYATEDAHERKPKLHFKTQFFGSREALSTLIPLEEWRPLLRNYIEARAEMVTTTKFSDVKNLREKYSKDVGPLVRAWEKKLTHEERERSIFYLSVGSHNMDYRGKIMDGEVTVIVSNRRAMMAYVDFINMLGLTTWVDSVEELNRLLPPYGGFWYKFGRWVKNAV
jgi:hypothetical protein